MMIPNVENVYAIWDFMPQEKQIIQIPCSMIPSFIWCKFMKWVVWLSAMILFVSSRCDMSSKSLKIQEIWQRGIIGWQHSKTWIRVQVDWIMFSMEFIRFKITTCCDFRIIVTTICAVSMQLSCANLMLWGFIMLWESKRNKIMHISTNDW
jgi:hypothetical protein